MSKQVISSLFDSRAYRIIAISAFTPAVCCDGLQARIEGIGPVYVAFPRH